MKRSFDQRVLWVRSLNLRCHCGHSGGISSGATTLALCWGSLAWQNSLRAYQKNTKPRDQIARFLCLAVLKSSRIMLDMFRMPPCLTSSNVLFFVFFWSAAVWYLQCISSLLRAFAFFIDIFPKGHAVAFNTHQHFQCTSTPLRRSDCLRRGWSTALQCNFRGRV